MEAFIVHRVTLSDWRAVTKYGERQARWPMFQPRFERTRRYRIQTWSVATTPGCSIMHGAVLIFFFLVWGVIYYLRFWRYLRKTGSIGCVARVYDWANTICAKTYITHSDCASSECSNDRCIRDWYFSLTSSAIKQEPLHTLPLVCCFNLSLLRQPEVSVLIERDSTNRMKLRMRCWAASNDTKLTIGLFVKRSN